MSIDDPDFFLASSEGYGLEEPRRCRIIRRMHSSHRNDLLLIEVDPPLIGQRYGLGGRDINRVLVATRHKETSLFPIKEWPIPVHVALCLVDDCQDRESLTDSELRPVAWAELYETEEDAKRKTM